MHTLGPWQLHEDFGGWLVDIGDFYNSHGGGDLIEVESEGNARLIAAAPDLLAALEYSLPWLELRSNENTVALVRAAIKKAKGETDVR
jgi:hypothetical protein